MGEAIISRASIPGEAETTVPITPGYHTILVTVRDYKNGLMQNYPINCKDGSSTYNYTTNEKGQAMFVTNSGAANIYATNVLSGYTYIDFDAQWTNIDTPVGLSTKVNIILSHNKTSSRRYTSNANIAVLYNHKLSNLILVGGGGGGYGGYSVKDKDGDREIYNGYGGGSGYMNQINTAYINGKYDIFIGNGGAGGGGDSYSGNARAGGTTSFINYYATGGSAGNRTNRGIGGLGNGGGEYGVKAENSPVTFAGGGGGAGGEYDEINRAGGKPYGGNGGYIYGTTKILPKNGGIGGGGGAGGASSYGRLNGGSGGSGIVMFNIEIV